MPLEGDIEAFLLSYDREPGLVSEKGKIEVKQLNTGSINHTTPKTLPRHFLGKLHIFAQIQQCLLSGMSTFVDLGIFKT